MKRTIKLIILFLLLTLFGMSVYFDSGTSPSQWKMISPFTGVTFEGETIRVEFQGGDYELVSIESITSADLIKAAKKKFRRDWQKRIREDIAEVLEAAGVGEVTRVDLELKDPETGEVKKVSGAEMTRENRMRGMGK